MNTEKLKPMLLEIVADIIQVPVCEVTSNESLVNYGFDSISLTTLANAINKNLATDISPSMLMEFESIDEIISFLNQHHNNNSDEVNKNFDDSVDSSLSEMDVHAQPMYKTKANIASDIINHELYFVPDAKPVVDDIAIIGMSCVVPGANNLQEFWAIIENGKSTISEFPAERWSWIKQNPTTHSYQQTAIKGGFIQDIDRFDAEAFHISPHEAKFLDPQQRLLLEQTWRAIEHAGYHPEAFAETPTGVFVGIATTDYQQIIESTAQYDSHYTTGTVHCLAANRLSYFFDLHGPSEAINTACSSSLIALNRAIQAIKSGECEMAIIAGVNALLHPGLTMAFEKAGMLSKEGLCRTFDESAEGYVRSEGVGVVILKKLSKAVTDKDHIYGIVKGSAVNHGGHVRSLTVPSADAQANVIAAALQNANIHMQTITYIEAHGTGTKLGDPIEIEGLKRAFSQTSQNAINSKNKFCAVTSVKSNIGHLEAAAGIIGLIKVLLMMQHEKIPLSANFSQLNQYIHLDDSPFYIPHHTIKWKRLVNDGQEIPRRAGVSSFGFGGSNVHVILEEYMQPHLEQSSSERQNEIPFIFSAHTVVKLKENITSMMECLSDLPDSISLINVAYSLAIGIPPAVHRAAIIASNKNELLQKMADYLEGKYDNASVFLNNDNRPLRQALSELKINLSDLIDYYLDKDNLTFILNVWVSGEAIEWQKYFQKIVNVTRAPLSLTKFNKKRYWIDDISSEEIIPQSLPAMDKVSVPHKIILNTIHPEREVSNKLPNVNNYIKKLTDLLAAVLCCEAHEIAIDKPFVELGLDSILGVEFLKAVNQQFGLALKAEVLYESYTINKLSDKVNNFILPENTHASMNGKKVLKNLSDAKEDLTTVAIDKEKIITILAKTLCTSAEKIAVAVDVPFSELGLDSILGVEFIKAIAQLAQLDVRAELLYEYSTINKIWDYLSVKLQQKDDSTLDTIDHLFEKVYAGEVSADKAIEFLN